MVACVVQIDYFVVVIVALRILICDAFCPNLMMMHAKRRYHTLTQGIEQLKHSLRTIATTNKFATNITSSVKCCDH